jgi:hypothetical protein
MHLQPIAERDHKLWLVASGIDDSIVVADPELDEMPVKELHPEPRVVASRSTV